MWCCSDLDLIFPSDSGSWSIPRTQRSVVETKTNGGVPVVCFHKESSALLICLLTSIHQALKKKKVSRRKQLGFFKQSNLFDMHIEVAYSLWLEEYWDKPSSECISLLPLPDSIRASCFWDHLVPLWGFKYKCVSLGEVTQETAVNL